MHRGFAASVCVVMAGLVHLSASQDRVGSLSGVITDTTGRRLPGATITAIAEQGEARRAITDSAGEYHIDGLNGRYRVEARMNGFITKVVETVVGPERNGIWGGALLVGEALDGISIERQVMRFVGLQAVDCGRYSSPASETDLQQSLECGLASARAGQPFSVIVQYADRDPQAGGGLLAAPDGLVHALEYDTRAATFRLRACPRPTVTASPKRRGYGFEFACEARVRANV